MSILVEAISRQALSLSAEERIQLAEILLSTVQEVDAEVEVAWDDEIKRRIIDVDSGAARLTPAKEVFAELRHLIQ